MANSNATVESIFWPKEQHRLLKQAFLVFMGVVLLFGASQLAIPFKPVPLTFQSAMVVLIGMTYGSRLGLATVIAYLAAGALGAPVFAEFSAGPQVFFGTTGGYLIGFIPAVLLSGLLADRGWACRYVMAFAAAILGALPIFLAGAVQLSFFIGWHAAWLVGVKPFLATELVKLFIIAFAAKQVWRKS
ncbi:MAG: biotin transporter BioY [Gammaproteobacteria bacterium]|nr:biotin transporter BioY [Gammaproteobacteria bacterium]